MISWDVLEYYFPIPIHFWEDILNLNPPPGLLIDDNPIEDTPAYVWGALYWYGAGVSLASEGLCAVVVVVDDDGEPAAASFSLLPSLSLVLFASPDIVLLDAISEEETVSAAGVSAAESVVVPDVIEVGSPARSFFVGFSSTTSPPPLPPPLPFPSPLLPLVWSDFFFMDFCRFLVGGRAPSGNTSGGRDELKWICKISSFLGTCSHFPCNPPHPHFRVTSWSD